MLSFEEGEERLLFNYMVSHEQHVDEWNQARYKFERAGGMKGGMKGKLGELFGTSLALLNIGFVENVTEKELDTIIVLKGQNHSEALSSLKEVSLSSIRLKTGSVKSSPEKTTDN